MAVLCEVACIIHKELDAIKSFILLVIFYLQFWLIVCFIVSTLSFVLTVLFFARYFNFSFRPCTWCVKVILNQDNLVKMQQMLQNKIVYVYLSRLFNNSNLIRITKYVIILFELYMCKIYFHELNLKIICLKL